MSATQEDNNFIIVCPATYTDLQALTLGNNTLLGCPPSPGAFLVDTSLFKARSLGNTLAAVAYGIAILLYFNCVGHLRRRPTQRLEIKRKWGPYAYITGMIGLSTAAFLQSTIYATSSTSLVRAEKLHDFVDTLMACGGAFPILFIIWMADGLMVSNNDSIKTRCSMYLLFSMQLYHTLGLYRRVQAVARYFLFAFLGALLLVSLGMSFILSIDCLVLTCTIIIGGGVLLIIVASDLAAWSSKDGAASFIELLIVESDEKHINTLINSGFFVSATTFIANLLLCVLIVARLLQQQKYFASVLGPDAGSAFRRIIVMCVESCALIVATIVLGGVLWFTAGHIYAMIPLLVLPQACVRPIYAPKIFASPYCPRAGRQCISALMLISRVAQRKATDTNLTPTDIAERVVPIHFICQADAVESVPDIRRMEDARWGEK